MKPALPLIAATAGSLVLVALLWLLIVPGLTAEALPGPDPVKLRLFHSTLPRLATAALAGFALALAGAIFQQVLRNPLASPTTLGISAGAHLALVLATLFFPALLGIGRDVIALFGSGLVALLIIGLGARRGFSPLSLVLSGLVVSLWCGALAAILGFLNDRSMTSLFIWGAGSLSTLSWELPLTLGWKLAVPAFCALLILRPLALLDLGEEAASALGLRLARIRGLALAIAVALSALVTSAVGVIGFIGLMAPVLARLLGARRVPVLLLASALIGAWLLLMTDAALQLVAGMFADLLPTGAITAVLGSPLLLLLLPRLKIRHRPLPPSSAVVRPRHLARLWLLLPVLCAILLLALLFGRDSLGAWHLSIEMIELRLPRALTALAAGAMLAVAGTLLQRLTGNEMASPEVLGISAGATLGLALGLFLLASPGIGPQLGFAAGGALTVLATILLLTRRAAMAPERVLLAGIALSALVDALSGLMAATGDPRALTLLRWMSGSTYNANIASAGTLLLAAAVMIPLALCAWRWLTLLPLGAATSGALGVPVARARLLLFLLAGCLSAVATLGVGPLSFVGLMAPHLARELGFARALPQTAAAALLGGALLVLADWIGRVIIFPWQIPAGLLAALTGAPFLIFLLSRRGRA